MHFFGFICDLLIFLPFRELWLMKEVILLFGTGIVHFAGIAVGPVDISWRPVACLTQLRAD